LCEKFCVSINFDYDYGYADTCHPINHMKRGKTIREKWIL